MKKKNLNHNGTTMIELVFALIIMGIVVFSIVAFIRGVTKGHLITNNKDIAYKQSVDTLNFVLSHAWDECLATNPAMDWAPLRTMPGNNECRQRIGTDPNNGPNARDDLGGILNNNRDDIDDFDQQSGYVVNSTNLRFKTILFVCYEDVKMDGTTDIVDPETISTTGACRGAGLGQRTDYKVIKVRTTWNESGQNKVISLVSIASNGRARGLQ